MDGFRKALALKALLLSVEEELGFTSLSAPEKAVLYAIGDLTNTEKSTTSDRLLDHSLTSPHSRPTVYRALASLLQKDLVVKDAYGVYRLNSQPDHP